MDGEAKTKEGLPVVTPDLGCVRGCNLRKEGRAPFAVAGRTRRQTRTENSRAVALRWNRRAGRGLVYRSTVLRHHSSGCPGGFTHCALLPPQSRRVMLGQLTVALEL